MLLAGGGYGDIDRAGLITINLNFRDLLVDAVVGSAISSHLSIVYYIYEINRWNRLTLFHLLIISNRKEMRVCIHSSYSLNLLLVSANSWTN